MFGRKNRKAAVAERPQVSLYEAISLAVHAQIRTEWEVDGLTVTGLEGYCSVRTNGYSYWLDLETAYQEALSLRERLGKSYDYDLAVFGTVVGHTLSSILDPGWRDYARPVNDVMKQFDSIKEFDAWRNSDEARFMDLTGWRVSARKK